MKNKKVVTNYQARNYRGAGVLLSPEKNFAPLWKNVLDMYFAPLSANSSPLLVSHSGYGLPIMLATPQQ